MDTLYVAIERMSTHSIPLNPIEKIDKLHRSKEVVGSMWIPLDL
jgi:hypothetical protein